MENWFFNYVFYGAVFCVGNITVSVLPPISTEGLTAADVTYLSVNTREKMLNEFNHISK